MSLGTLTIDLAANVARLSGDLGKANRLAEKSAAQMEKRFSQMKTVLGTMFAGLSVGAFSTWIKQSIDAADEINDLSKKLGVSSQDLQQWNYAASLSGGSAETMAMGLKNLNILISDAAGGSEDARAKFARLGVEFQDSNGKIRDTSSVLLDISDRFQATADDANKTALSVDVFKKAGLGMIPVLDSGSESLRNAMQQAQDFGLVMSAEAVQASDDFNDSLTTLQGVSRGYANQIASALLPSLNSLTGFLIDSATESENSSDKFLTLNNTIKILTSTAIGVAAAFDIVGKRLGAALASISAMTEGEFAKSAQIIDMANEDAVKIMEQASAKIDKVWNGTYENIGKKATETSAIIKPSLGAISEKEKELTDLTKKHAAEISGVSDKQYAYNQKIAEYKTLLDSGQISQNNYAKAVKSASDELNKKSESTNRATRSSIGHADAVANEIKQLEYKVSVLGMTDSQTELYKLTTEGATQAQLDHSKVLLDQVDAFEKDKKAKEDATDYQKELNDKMRQYDELITGAKSGTTEYGQALHDLNELYKSGNIKTQEEYNAAVGRLNKKYEDAGKAAIDWSKIQEDAINSGKDALADFLYDPLEGGFSGMVDNFTEALRKMSAQAAAAGIMESIFSKDNMASLSSWFSSLLGMTSGASGGASSASGFAGMISSIGSMFSFDGGGYTGDGARSGGMDGKGGFMAMIHPNEQIIDYTKPSQSNYNSASNQSGNVTVNQTINTTGKIDRRTSNQIASDTYQKQRLARARFGA